MSTVQVAADSTAKNTDEPSLEKEKRASTHPWLLNVFIGIASLLFSLVLIEIGFRVITSFEHPIRWSDRPKKYLVSNSYLDKPDVSPYLIKDKSKYRILVLGDSFTYGQNLQSDDTFSFRLGRLLNSGMTKGSVEVLNWGVKGYSTMDEVNLLKRDIDKLTPDFVLLEITLNDPELEPYRVTHPWLDEHGRVKLNNPIFHYWHSLAFVFKRILNSQTQKSYVEYYQNIFSDPKGWENFEHALTQFKEMLTKRGIPHLAVIFPLFSHTINDQYPFYEEHEKLHRKLNELSLPYTDLIHRYDDIPHERLQVIPGVDSHPNEIAHRIATEGIYSKLKQLKMLPEGMSELKVVTR